MATKRKLAEKQIELQSKMIALSNVNLVTCGHCGTVLLHDLTDEEIECFACKSVLEQSDCPDLWYEGCQNNSEFDEDFQSVDYIKQHYEEMKLAIDDESVNIYIVNGVDKDVTNVCYWHLDEVAEDSDVAISIANAINLFHTDKLKLVETLFGKVK